VSGSAFAVQYRAHIHPRRRVLAIRLGDAGDVDAIRELVPRCVVVADCSACQFTARWPAEMLELQTDMLDGLWVGVPRILFEASHGVCGSRLRWYIEQHAPPPALH
jgi:hypothetical protein